MTDPRDDDPHAWTMDEALAELLARGYREQTRILSIEEQQKIEQLIALFKRMSWNARVRTVKVITRIYRRDHG